MTPVPDRPPGTAPRRTKGMWRLWLGALLFAAGAFWGGAGELYGFSAWPSFAALIMSGAALIGTSRRRLQRLPMIVGGVSLPAIVLTELQPPLAPTPTLWAIGALLAASSLILLALPVVPAGWRFLRIVVAMAVALWLLIALQAGIPSFAQSLALAGYAIVAAVALTPAFRIGTNGFAAFAAAAAAGTALLVAIGWWTGNAVVVQAATDYVPMQFNTAVTMSCLAVAFWLALHRQRRYGLPLLIPIFVFGVATLLEEFAGAALGVGNWLLSHPIVAEQVQPGRMAPNTAIGALLVAVGILAMPDDRTAHPQRAATTWLCGFAACVLASFVLAGYFLELPMMRSWGSTTPMALLTALSLFLLGLALATLRLESSPRTRGPRAWTPMLIGLAGAMLILAVWVSAQKSNREGAGAELARQLEATADAAAATARERASALRRVGLRALDAADADALRASFRRDARDYLDDYDALEGLALTLRATGIVDAIARNDAQLDCLRNHLRAHPDAASTVYDCQGRTMLASRILARRGDRRAHVLGVYALTSLLVNKIDVLDPAIPVRLRMGDRVVYQHGEGDGKPVVRAIALDHALSAALEAHLPSGAGRSHGVLTGFLLIGTLACALLALSLRLSGLARERARTAELGQSALAAQSSSMQRLQADLLRAQEIAGLGHWAYEPASAELDWSEGLNRVLGLAPEQAPTSIEAVADLVHAEDRERWREAHAATLAGEGDLALDFRILLGNGEIRHLHERARLLKHPDGRPWLLSATVQDISERERMTEAIAQSEERFRLIARATADALWDWDIDARTVWYSDGMEKLFGIPGGRHDSEIASWSLRVHPGDRQRVVGSIDAAVVGEINEWESEYRFLSRDDHYVHVHDRGFVLRDATGRAIRMVGGMTDVTAQREMQHRQERINRALRLLSACSDAMFAADDESWLLHEVCRLALADGRYELAWIGYALEDLSQTIRPMAVQGRAASLILDHAAAFQWSGVDPGSAGAPGRAIHGAVPVVVRDLAQVGDDWAAHALADGLYSAICLPLQSRERVFGVIALYGADPIVAVPPELSILQDLADSLSRGIVALRLRREQERLQQTITQVASTVYGGHDHALFSALLESLVGALDGRGALLFRFDAASDRRARLLSGMLDGVALVSTECDRGDLPFAELHDQPQFACLWPERGGPLSDLPPVGEGLMLHGVRINDNDGRNVGALCLLHDQTQASAFMWSTLHVFAARATAEMARVERERFIREQATLLDKAIEAIFVCDAGGRIRYWNEGAVRLFGHARHEAVGQPVAEIVGLGDERVRRLFEDLAAKQELRDAFPLARPSGETLAIEAHWSRVHSGQDEGEAFLCIAIDITERQRMLARVQDSETRLQAIFDTAAEGIVTINADGTIESANPHALALFGYAREELAGRNVRMLMPEPLASAHDGFIARYLETGHMALPSTDRVLTGRRRDGSVFPVELSVRDVQLVSGRLFTGFVRDITARREAEAAMKQLLRDLDSQNQGLQEFVYIASHDLQEPLRKIRVFSDRVLETQGSILDAQNRDFLARAIAAAQRMQSLIDDLLAYSRVTAKALHIARVDLGQVVAAVVDDLTLRIEQTGARVLVDALPAIEGDATQLRQLFQNLIGNALKYAAPDRAPAVRVSSTADELAGRPAWRICIEDNGIGFDNRHAEKIFAPFQRLHTRQEYDGSGIGLAIVKRITNRHGGTVSARGEPGVGATFVVILPASQSARPGG
jgi:PAS domain S-box-containing protein